MTFKIISLDFALTFLLKILLLSCFRVEVVHYWEFMIRQLYLQRKIFFLTKAGRYLINFSQQ